MLRRRTLSQLRIEGLAVRDVGPIDLVVAPGECVCLSGPSGSGKTVILRAIADLDPHRGEVYLDGESRARMKPWAWRRRVGMLPAESVWWRQHVGEHFPNPEPAAFAQLGFGMEVLDWDVMRSSTGERQRLALLRLLGNRPDALLLDEPTASLDPESVSRAEQLIGDYRRRQRAAVLWVSHDPKQIARVADRHLRLIDGRLVPA